MSYDIDADAKWIAITERAEARRRRDHDRTSLSFRAVHIQCLDCDNADIRNANASGFIVNENNQLFLYTCWHVVAGYDMHNIKVGRHLPNRESLRVTLQNYETLQPGVSSLGGNQSITIPLYSGEEQNLFPVWIQEKKDKPHADLNSINVKVPSLHDVAVSDMQTLSNDDIYTSLPVTGDKLLIVGFPYGYSVLGMQQPTPIVLTRFLADWRYVEGRDMHLLMDGPGAPGMSGGPVFVERDDALYLTGIYTGLIYPDHIIGQNDKTTALGIYCNMIAWSAVEKNPSEVDS